MSQKKKPIAKKRSMMNERSLLTPPTEFDRTKYAGRWVAEHRLSLRSDGYEPRGYSVWKNAEGASVKSGDLVWCYKSKEEALEESKERLEAAVDQRRQIAADDSALSDRVDWELRQLGGGMKSDITFEE